MSVATPLALTLIRVPRGNPRPSDDAFQAALARDRDFLRLPTASGQMDIQIAGPYPVEVDGSAYDEYVAWER